MPIYSIAPRRISADEQLKKVEDNYMQAVQDYAESIRNQAQSQIDYILDRFGGEPPDDYVKLPGDEITAKKRLAQLRDRVNNAMSIAMAEYDKDIESLEDKVETEKITKGEIEQQSEWLTVKDIVEKTLAEPEPEFTPESVAPWEEKLAPLYETQKEKALKTTRDVWGSLFPQGGGSGAELDKAINLLKDIDMEKLTKAIDFASAEYGGKLGTWQTKQQQAIDTLFNIGKVKSDVDLAKYLQNLGIDWEKKKTLLSRDWATQDLAQQEEMLNKYLEKYASKDEPNIWEQVLSTLTSGIGTGAGLGIGKGLYNLFT